MKSIASQAIGMECLCNSPDQHGQMKVESENKQIDFYAIIRMRQWSKEKEKKTLVLILV